MENHANFLNTITAMNYSDVIDRLYQIGRSTSKIDLRNITQLMSFLDSPHKNLNCIHVGGTNGKGSTCAMISSILQASGYDVGMYTSPHLHEFSERIQINDQPIDPDDVIRLSQRILKESQKMERSDDVTHPSFFEICTAMAFTHFYQQNVDFAVIEVGLGGRLDATNIIDPLVSVITNVGIDHSGVLGESIAEIAEEKAGIIKLNRPVVTTVEKKEALEVIKEKAERKNSPLVQADELVSVEKIGEDINCQHLRMQGRKNYKVGLPLKGKFQHKNMMAAVSAIEQLRLEIAKNEIINGLENVNWPGRIEIISRGPDIVVDCAHNAAAMKNLSSTISKLEFEDLIFVLGVSRNKEKYLEKMLEKIACKADKLIITQATYRGLNPEKIEAKVEASEIEHRIEEEVEDAVNRAKVTASPKDLICISGSTFVVDEARKAIQT